MPSNDPRKPFVAALTCLLTASCAVVAPKIERDLPSASLLAPCPEPETDFSTNGGLARAINAYRAALGLCNADKTALREWAK